MEKANVVLLHKGSDKSNVNNYHPISLLPLPGKLLESIIHSRLLDYLSYYGILSDKQWGFRPGRSTIDASSNLLESILLSINSKKHTGVLFIDLQKAFDSIDHEILINKLNAYGVRENALLWFRSYLSDRVQRVLVNNTSSDYCSITHGVPQGSCLGPLLFLVYINDIAEYLPTESLNLYADDTAILAVADDIHSLNCKLQSLASDLSKWCLHNKLNINIGKSKTMHFAPSIQRSNSSCNSLSISINNAHIEQVHHYKYLGFIIDDQLNCRKLVSNTVSKLNNILFTFRKIRPSLSLKASIAVLKAKFISYIDYISMFSYLLSKSDFKKLQVLQNHCIRITFCLPKRSNVEELHCKLKLLHLENRRYLFLMKYMFHQANHLISESRPALTGINTRSSLKRNFSIVRPLNNRYMKSHLHQGRLLWNALPLEMQRLPDINWFKRSLKQGLLEVEKALYTTA